jgi:hypothetical protein
MRAALARTRLSPDAKKIAGGAYVLAGNALEGTIEAGCSWPHECITGALLIKLNKSVWMMRSTS